MSALTVLIAVAILVYVIGQQVIGSSLTGRRAVALPVVLTAVGVIDLTSGKSVLGASDIALIAIGAAVSIAVGLGLGVLTRIESREGHLWVQLPKQGLLLWAALILSRVLLVGVAHAVGADAAASGSAILLTLGLNRVAQALVVVPRAVAAGIPFAPEKDGRVLLSGLFGGQVAQRTGAR